MRSDVLAKNTTSIKFAIVRTPANFNGFFCHQVMNLMAPLLSPLFGFIDQPLSGVVHTDVIHLNYDCKLSFVDICNPYLYFPLLFT